jgi:hypothetical protein
MVVVDTTIAINMIRQPAVVVEHILANLILVILVFLLRVLVGN